MYSENPVRDLVLFSKAVLSNQLARVAPGLYVRLTRQTGRGAGEEAAGEVADYFLRCYEDYRQQLDLDEQGFRDFLKDKVVLEYGPGDIMGVALLFYANGARRVECVDKFPLAHLSDFNVEVYRQLVDRLDDPARSRAEAAFLDPGRPESGLNPDMVAT